MNAQVAGSQFTGALVGDNQGGRISATYATVTVNGHRNFGGLVGYNRGTISTSYITGLVNTVGVPPYSGNALVRFDVGGLAGTNDGGTIEASYSTASVVHDGDVWYYGLAGLVGGNIGGGAVRNSYSTGKISDAVRYASGLIRENEKWSGSTISNSYYDAETSGISGDTGAKTTAELQSPTSASGIYAQWSPQTWDFGTETDYPLLVVDFDSDGVASWQEFGQLARSESLPFIDYDADNDGLIEIRNLEQLNAMRWDLDGNGQSKNHGYRVAFPNPTVDKGCEFTITDGIITTISDVCRGYELATDLDFNDAGSYASGGVNTAWTSGTGWTPIGSWSARWSAAFEGNGHTISNLHIDSASLREGLGLIGAMNSSGSIRRLGLVNADVKGELAGNLEYSHFVGALVGHNKGGDIAACYGSVAVHGGTFVGGLVA